MALGDGIAKNKSSKVETLGLRFNFLSEDGVTEFLKTVKDSQNIKELFIKNNRINEYGLFQLKKAYDNLKGKTNIDIFDKLKYL